MSIQPQLPVAVPSPAADAGDILATYGSRVGALLLDTLFSSLVLVIGVAAKSTAVALLGFLGLLIYPYVTMLRSGPNNGQTLGKQIVRIRVVPQSAVPISFGVVLLRELVGKGLLAAFTLYIYTLFDYLWPIWDDKNQALHDKIASTLVVKADADPARIAKISEGGGFAPLPPPPPPAPPPPPPAR